MHPPLSTLFAYRELLRILVSARKIIGASSVNGVVDTLRREEAGQSQSQWPSS